MSDHDRLTAQHSPCAIRVLTVSKWGTGRLIQFRKTYPLDSMLPGKVEHRIAFFGEEPGAGSWDMSCG